MATRIIESRRDRLITMLITPFMSCSARLPVYILFISAFFAKNHGSVLFLLYVLGIIFQTDSNLGKKSLVEKIQNQQYSSGKKVFTPLIAFSFMLFILTYFPCIGVVAAIRRESGSWKWAAFTVFYTTGIAWLLSFTVYQIGSLFIN